MRTRRTRDTLPAQPLGTSHQYSILASLWLVHLFRASDRSKVVPKALVTQRLKKSSGFRLQSQKVSCDGWRRPGRPLPRPSTQDTARVPQSAAAVTSSALSRRTRRNRWRSRCQRQTFCVDFMLSKNNQIESKTFPFFRHVLLSQIPHFTDEVKTQNSSGKFSMSEVTFS